MMAYLAGIVSDCSLCKRYLKSYLAAWRNVMCRCWLSCAKQRTDVHKVKGEQTTTRAKAQQTDVIGPR
jgi:hypothetical protein